MPNLTTEQIGTGDQRWLGSTHAIYNTQSVSLLKSAFTAGTHFPNGYVPSGTPITKNTDGYGVPYAGTGPLLFVYTDSKVTGDAYVNAAALDHGRIRTKYVPGSFTPPANDAHFVFITAADA